MFHYLGLMGCCRLSQQNPENWLGWTLRVLDSGEALVDGLAALLPLKIAPCNFLLPNGV
jgi:hypothetical protein